METLKELKARYSGQYIMCDGCKHVVQVDTIDEIEVGATCTECNTYSFIYNF